jgi:hypothetical protein
MRRLKRVKYVEVKSENAEKLFWYLNLTQVMVDQLILTGLQIYFRIKD